MSEFPPLSDEIIQRFDVQAPRYTSYPTVPAWRSGLTSSALIERLCRASEHPSSPLSLYVHLPFCRERCTFCGCNVVITKERSRVDEYLDHVARELQLFADRLGTRRRLSQIHWGGGTPTFLDETQIRRLWTDITQRFSPLPDAEIAIEIDPAETTPSQLTLLRSLGFNRISMGIQDFDLEVQRAVNRLQTYDETKALLDHARKLGFASINFDLIYGLPLQTAEKWDRTLEQVLSLAPDRIAVYSFAYVPTVRPHQKRLAVLPMPTGAPKLELFRAAYDTFIGRGYVPIGMDHFALPGDELSAAQRERRLTRNFQGYSVKAATDVIAVGVSAISDIQGMYSQNVQVLPKYYRALQQGSFPVERGMSLSDDDRLRRRVITELMCNFWVDLGPRCASFERELGELKRFEDEGLVKVRGSEIELTKMGRVFVRNVAMVFDAYAEKAKAAGMGFSRTV